MTDNYVDVTVRQANAMLDAEVGLMVLDVRTPEEYSLWHLKNARLIPVDELARRQGELSKSDPVLVYCRLSVRSRRASQILVGNGFMRVYNMLGGISAWLDAGFPVCSHVSSLKRTIARVRIRFRRLLPRRFTDFQHEED